jgi:hypothetical protein
MPPPHKPNRPNRTLLVLGAVAGLAGVIATTAAITYSVARHPSAAPNSTAGPTATASAEQQAAAKKRVCEIFDAGTKGQAGKGGVRVDGQLNIPVVAQAARGYVARVFDLTTEATGDGNIDALVRLNADTNKAIDSLLDACGLPR